LRPHWLPHHQHVVTVRQRLNREVKVWSRLNHPNIAQFYGVSSHLGGRPAIVMKWYENGTAPRFLSSKSHEHRLKTVRFHPRFLSPFTNLTFSLKARDVCEGLRYLHEMPEPVIHGDLKGVRRLSLPLVC